MEQFEGQNILNFIKELPNDDACKAYLAKIKWQDGFACMKCGHTKGCKKVDYRYHCYDCQHVESPQQTLYSIRLNLDYKKHFVLFLK